MIYPGTAWPAWPGEQRLWLLGITSSRAWRALKGLILLEKLDLAYFWARDFSRVWKELICPGISHSGLGAVLSVRWRFRGHAATLRPEKTCKWCRWCTSWLCIPLRTWIVSRNRGYPIDRWIIKHGHESPVVKSTTPSPGLAGQGLCIRHRCWSRVFTT
jgi:hypothetical protein